MFCMTYAETRNAFNFTETHHYNKVNLNLKINETIQLKMTKTTKKKGDLSTGESLHKARHLQRFFTDQESRFISFSHIGSQIPPSVHIFWQCCGMDPRVLAWWGVLGSPLSGRGIWWPSRTKAHKQTCLSHTVARPDRLSLLAHCPRRH